MPKQSNIHHSSHIHLSVIGLNGEIKYNGKYIHRKASFENLFDITVSFFIHVFFALGPNIL